MKVTVSELKPNDIVKAFLGAKQEVTATYRVLSLAKEGPFDILRMRLLSRSDGRKLDSEVVKKPVHLDWQVERMGEG